MVHMIAIADVLVTLAVKRPIFHSEADFQHALAWEIHQRIPEAAVRLERSIAHAGRLIYLDLWVADGPSVIAIELKYKTRPLEAIVAGESFRLLSHGAQDLGRYDFLKDIRRLEAAIVGSSRSVGYAILITNDSTYWSPARANTSIDAAFRLSEGRSLNGTLAWGDGAGAGTTRGREQPIVLRGTYPLQWFAYSEVPAPRYGIFRSLVVPVAP
jgi:hypothetical protein